MILKWNPSLYGGIQVVAFDLEATSTIPNQTFIFKVYAERSDGEVFDKWVKPPGGINDIPQKVRDLCKLSEADLREIDTSAGWEVIGPAFYTFISGCVLVAYNGKGYDLLLIHKEEERVRSSHPTAFDNTTLASVTAGTLDVMEVVGDGRINFVGIMGKPRPVYASGRPIRKLDKLYVYVFGEELEAHDAEADTQGMMKLLDELDPTGKIRKDHISYSVEPWLVIPKLQRLVKAANITVNVDDPGMISNILLQIRDNQNLENFIIENNWDLSPLMPSINNVVAPQQQHPSDYQPPYHLLHFCALVMVLARSDDFNDASVDERTDLFYKCMHEFIEGIDQNNPGVYFLPYADSTNAQSNAANFIDGALFRILQIAMPTALGEVVADLLRYNEFGRDEMASGSVLAGAIEGDGSIFCKSGGLSDPKWDVSIHTNDGVLSPYKELLKRYYSCTVTSANVHGKFDYKWCQSPFMVACNNILCIKWLQFIVVCVLFRPLRIGGDNISMYTPLVSLTRRLAGAVLGALNVLHGVGLRRDWYRSRFERMVEHALPLLFQWYAAGLSSTDACVAPRLMFFQSNEAYLQVFGEVLAEELDFNEENEFGLGSHNLRDVSRLESSTNSRAQFALEYNEKQTAELILYCGIFDYARRSQWLVVLVRYLLYTVSNLEDQDEVRDFLDGLLSYIKHVNPS